MANARTRGLAEELLGGARGGDVVQRMRADKSAYSTACSLSTHITVVRQVIMASGDPRSMHRERDETLRVLLERASLPDVSPTCRLQAQAFAADTLRNQVLTLRQHQRHKFCLGHPEVDDALRRVELLTDNMRDFRVNDDEADQCRRQSTERVVRRNEQVLMVPAASAVLQRAEDILRTAGPKTTLSALGFALLLTTGRRTAELLNGRSQFLPGPNPMSAVFHGQLKTEHPSPYTIPILVKFELLRKGLDALRARQGNWDAATQQFKPCAPGKRDVLAITNRQVNTRYASHLNRDLRRLYFLPNANNHDCRRFYAVAVWVGFDYQATPVTFNRVAMRFLGHSELHTSLSYNSVRLIDFEHRFPVAYRLPVANDGVAVHMD
jgi:hypothetical protein